MRRSSVSRLAAAARSGLRRYPRHLWESLREASPDEVREELGKAAVSRLVNAPGLAAHWIGHASVLLRIGGTTLLTDPVFAQRIGMSFGKRTFGIQRMTPASIDAAVLPPIDYVLLSHAHFDHLDRPSLEQLADSRTKVITAARTGGLIPRGFGDIIELPWDRDVSIGPLRIQAMKPAHWGARTALDRSRGFNSYVIESGGGTTALKRVLFAGDTALTDVFERVDPVDLAIFGIGAYDPWEHAHATPEQVWKMFMGMKQSASPMLLPMHHSTFELSDEHPAEPMHRLLAAAGEQAMQVVCREIGGSWGDIAPPT